ncbi:MAG: hypothetical protein V7K81_11855 [Nostoc sp.]
MVHLPREMKVACGRSAIALPRTSLRSMFSLTMADSCGDNYNTYGFTQ